MDASDRLTEDQLRQELFDERADNYKLLAEVGVLKKKLAAAEARIAELENALAAVERGRNWLLGNNAMQQLATAHGLLREAVSGTLKLGMWDGWIERAKKEVSGGN